MLYKTIFLLVVTVLALGTGQETSPDESSSSTSTSSTSTTSTTTTTTTTEPPTPTPTTTTTTTTTTEPPTSTTTTTTSKPTKSSFDSNVIKATKNLLGINCLVEAVFDIENNANDFTYDIEVCGGKAAKIVADALADTEDLTKVTAKIIDLDDNVCRNAAYNPKTDAKKKPPAACASKIKKQMTRLNDVTQMTKTDLSNVSTKNSCVAIAANTYKLGLNNFAAYVENCAIVAANV